MPDLEKIRQLVDMMVRNDIVELNVREGDLEIKLRRPGSTHSDMTVVSASNPSTGSPAPASQTAATSDDLAAVPADSEDVELLEIKSPMVGTFYAAPDPDSPSFVEVGSKVGPSSVVCVLEAMKVFSEIKAEVSGAIERILVRNEEPVEFGQVLFLVRPE